MKLIKTLSVFLLMLFAKQINAQQWESFETYVESGAQQMKVLSDGSYCIVGSISQNNRTFKNEGYNSKGGKDFYWTRIDSAYNVEAVYTYGGTGDDDVVAFEVDDEDNVYVLGYYTGMLILGTDTFISSGGSDVFIVKMSWLDGTVVWANTFRTGVPKLSSGDLYFSENKLFFTVGFGGNIDKQFDTLIVNSDTFVSQGGQDIMYGSFDPKGVLKSFNTLGGTGNDYPEKIRKLNSGLSLMVTPEFKFKVDKTWFEKPNIMGRLFSALILFSEDNTVNWVQYIGYKYDRFARAQTFALSDMEVDSDGNSYVAGMFYAEKLYCDGKTVSGPNRGSGGWDVFYLKIDTQGECGWLKAGGAYGQDVATDIMVYDSSRIILGGDLGGGGWFGADTIPSAKSEAFLLEFDADGNNLHFELLCGTSGSRIHDINKLPAGKLAVLGGTGNGIVKLGKLEDDWPSDFSDVYIAIRNFIPLPEDTSTIGIDEAALSDLVLYPNPTRNKVYINSNNWHLATATVYGMHGTKIYISTVNYNEIQLGSLSNGIYRLELKLDDKWINKRIQIKK